VFGFTASQFVALLVLIALLIAGPFFPLPDLPDEAAVFALFACPFNLLIANVGLLSFGHAAYFGMGGYIAGYTAKSIGLSPELAVLAGRRWPGCRAGCSAGSPSAGRASTSP